MTQRQHIFRQTSLMNNKEQFIIFLRSQEVSDTTSKIYVDKLSNRINEICAKQRRASSFDIFSIGSLSEAQKIVEELQSDPIYISSNEKDHRIGSSAISWFLKFWRCRDLFKETTHITSENKNFTSDAPLQQITYEPRAQASHTKSTKPSTPMEKTVVYAQHFIQTATTPRSWAATSQRLRAGL